MRKTAVEKNGEPQPKELIWYHLGIDIGYKYLSHDIANVFAFNRAPSGAPSVMLELFVPPLEAEKRQLLSRTTLGTILV